MRDLPGPGIEPVSPALAGRFLSTRLLGKSQVCLLIKSFSWLDLVTLCTYFGLSSVFKNCSCYVLYPCLQNLCFCSHLCNDFGEGNGNPLQCSCLENPRDGEAWWAAVYGVARSQTQLKWLSSSSSSSSSSTGANSVIFVLPKILWVETHWRNIFYSLSTRESFASLRNRCFLLF